MIDLLKTATRLKQKGQPFATATLVSIEGSSYRGLGAHMLVGLDGATTGAISGGCLEGDVAEWGKRCLKDNTSRLLTYDTSDEELVWGLGLGCGGKIQVLVEPYDETTHFPWLGFHQEALTRGTPGVMATLFEVTGSGCKTGSRMAFNGKEIRGDEISASEIKAQIHQSGIQLLREVEHRFPASTPAQEHKLIHADGEVRVLLEPVIPRIPLVICGAGYDARPLVEMASQLDFHITLCDHREAYASEAHFPKAHERLILDPEELPPSVRATPTVALLMTHNYDRDLRWLKALAQRQIAYLGILGPKDRTARILNRARAEGITLDPELADKLFSPVGLDIGAETPQEIALSIMSEIKAVLNQRSGGHLRQRKGAIHER